MRIAVVTTSLNGGAGIAAVRHARLLEFMGHDVVVISARNLSVFRKILMTVINKIENVVKPLFIRSKYLSSLNLFTLINTKDEFTSCDVVFIHWTCGNFVSVSGVKKIARNVSKIHLYLHDEWWVNGLVHYEHQEDSYTKLGKLIKEFVERQKLDLVSSFICSVVAPTEYILDLVSKRYTNVNKVLLENPIGDWPKIPVVNKDIDILFFASGGISDPRKGYDYFLKVVSSLNLQSFTAVVVGCKGQTVKAGNGMITFLGEMDFENIAEVLARTKYLLNCSMADNYPNVIIEALYYNVRVIAFDVGGVKEALLEESIVSYGDFKSMADKLEVGLVNYKTPKFKDDLIERNLLELINKYECFLLR